MSVPLSTFGVPPGPVNYENSLHVSDRYGVLDILLSGFSSSKVSACSLIIKKFCVGKAGCIDSSIFIETYS